MSSGNDYPGHNPNWPPKKPVANAGLAQDRQPAPAWPPQTAPQHPSQSGVHPSWGHADPQSYPSSNYPSTGYPAQTAPQAPNYAQPQFRPVTQPTNQNSAPAASPSSYGGNNPFAPNFDYTPPSQRSQPSAPRAPTPVQQSQPYVARPMVNTQNAPQAAPSSVQQQPAFTNSQWAALQADPRRPDPRGYDAGNYHSQPQVAQPTQQNAYRAAEPRFEADPAPMPSPLYGDRQQGQQGHQHQAPGYPGDTYAQQATDDMGFAQASGGELDQAYDDDEYEAEETPRRSRMFMMVAALVGAITVGGGLTFGYQTILGNSGSGDPPVIKSAANPSKIKPVDAGGKVFAHSDSKIMGRLGEGSAGTATVAAASNSAEASEMDANGTRKVSTLVVGRDGSIQAPLPDAPIVAAALDANAAGDAVPGLTVVDALNQNAARTNVAAVAAAPTVPQVVNTPPQKIVVTPPPSNPQPEVDATGSIEEDVAPPPVAKKPPVKKIAAASSAATSQPSAAAPLSTSNGANGYVAVLASVPRSSTSRIEALKRFADMQQKYSSALTGKTPDVAEANLGAKGEYHRLVVGPPASREQASGLCSQLKSQGYADCWVTAY
ncbi:MAG: sporulation protein [Hyphomicrobium sp.]|nr:MAG: sporulation protein [Hyphomicrobium sp.]